MKFREFQGNDVYWFFVFFSCLLTRFEVYCGAVLGTRHDCA